MTFTYPDGEPTALALLTYLMPLTSLITQLFSVVFSHGLELGDLLLNGSHPI